MTQLFYNEMETAKAAKDLISKKLFNSARDVIHIGLTCFPDSKHLQSLRAQVAVKMSDHCTAVFAYEALLAQDPNNQEYLLHVAQAQSHTGEPEKALAYAEKYIAVSHDKSNGLFAMGDIYERNNMPEKTIRILDDLDEKTRADLRWKYLEMRVLLSTKEYEQAIDLILKHRDEV